MKKIGIVTLYHKNYNYGGILQAYAMQKIFSSCNCEAQLIDYQIHTDKYILKRIRDLGLRKFMINSCRKIVFKLIMGRKKYSCAYHLKIERFDAFMDTIAHTSLYSEESIGAVNELFDVFVCGSDQVWNPGWWNDILLLKFAHKPKYAYAASIARAALKKDEEALLKDAIKDFEAISVREKQAKALLSSITERNIEFALDPTLLVDKGEWEKIAILPPIKESYALLYMVGDASKVKEKIYNMCKLAGIKVVSIAFSKNTYYSTETKYADIIICDAGPREWLGWIREAEYIFTDSFHGSVFSILFEKKFWVFERDNADAPQNENTRIYNFMEITGLQKRLITKEYAAETLVSFPQIDYDMVSDRLEGYRYLSYSFIRKITNQCGNEN